MPLINLRSNLTNNKFGNDRPGYGSSGLPYIQTKIPSAPFSAGEFNPIYRPGSTGVLDFPIRGGGPGDLAVGQQTLTLSSKIDSIRIKKFLEDKSRGPAFLQKQVGLQLTNPKMETGNTLFGLGQGAPLPGLIENTRVYDPTGRLTLAQVAAMGSGAHAIRSGLVAFAPTQKHYFSIVNQQNVNNVSSTNRLLNLNALKMTSAVSPFVNPENVFDIERVNTLGISLNRNILFQYLGGPGSVYGTGTTTINRVVDTTKLTSSRVMTYDQLKQQKNNTQNILVSNADNTPHVTWLSKNTYKINDFRTGLDGVEGSYVPWKNPTTGKDDRVDARFYVSLGKYKDKLNLLNPFLFNNSVEPWNLPLDNNTSSDDLIKLVFEAISNDNPNYSVAIFFRAFLTSGITDNHSAQLNSFKYMGRGENFYTYQGFDRSVNFSFKMAAGSKEELIPMYNRLNTLVSQVYPDYSSPGNIMRAPLVRLTIGDYFYRMPGFLESVNITVDNGYPWEINLDQDSAQLPQVVDVSVSFKPILSELPKRTSTKIQTSTLSTDALTGITKDTNELTTEVAQLIANNDSVINRSVGSTVYSTTRNATSEERQSALDKATKVEIPPYRFSVNAASTARIRAAQETQYFEDVKYKNNYFEGQ